MNSLSNLSVGFGSYPGWFITVFNFRIGTKWVFANIPKENSEL